MVKDDILKKIQKAKRDEVTELDLSSYYLTSLPSEITKLTNLTALDLEKNPLERPPLEIANQGIKAIFEWLGQNPEEVHNEAKLIFVGQGEVGKTCLANRLKYDKFIECKTTEGIDILDWNISAPTKDAENIKLNIWDFGGQEIYHATHQFFLTKRSLYLLVWNARKSKDYEHIYYWLHTVEAFGEDSPIILVMSKFNERDDDLNMKDLKDKYPQLVGLYKVDSEDGKGISALKDIISQTAWNLPHMRTPWPASWLKVRKQLEQDKKDGLDWIGYAKYQQICRKEGLDKQEQMDILDKYLHDLGVIIHFRDRKKLQNIVILNPKWATDAVYKVIDTQSVKDGGGVLLHSELDKIWDPELYPLHIHTLLMDLMNEFELAFELPDKKSYLVAELLPSTEPEFEWNIKDNLCFYYRYDFLPAGVMTRFIVRVHAYLECMTGGCHLCWREGAVLRWGGARAFAKVKPQDKLIEIKIDGNQKRELLAIIRKEFDEINESFKKVKITKEIPCNCSEGCNKVWNYDNLINLELNQMNDVTCDVKAKTTTVSSMLDGYETRVKRMERQSPDERITNIFRPRIEVSPEIRTDIIVSQDINVETTINIDIKVDLPAIQSDFRKFKREVAKLGEDLKEELEDIENDLLEITPNSEQGKINRAMNKLSSFMGELGDENSKFNKIVKGSKKGIELAQKLAMAYNRFSLEYGLPEVTDLFS